MTHISPALAALNLQHIGVCVLRDGAAEKGCRFSANSPCHVFCVPTMSGTLFYVLNYKRIIKSTAALGGTPLSNKWVCFSPLLLVLQNRVRGGEDADKLVCLLAPQISQGKMTSFLATPHRSRRRSNRWQCFLKLFAPILKEICCACCCCSRHFKWVVWILWRNNGYLWGQTYLHLCNSKGRESSILLRMMCHALASAVLMNTDLFSSPHFFPVSHFLFSPTFHSNPWVPFQNKRSVRASLSSCCSVPSNSKWRRDP